MFTRSSALHRNTPSRRRTVKHRTLGGELLEPRTMLSAAPLLALGRLLSSTAPTLTSASIAPSAGSTLSGVSEQLAAVGWDQSGHALSSSLRYTWSVSKLPSGATGPTFSANSSSAAEDPTVTFATAGTYGLTVVISDSGGHSASSSITVTVKPVFTYVRLVAASSGAITGTNQHFNVQELDQFGNPLTPSQPTYKWSASTLPAGAAAPSFNAAAATTTVTFTQAGTYVLAATVSDGGKTVSGTLAAGVVQTLSQVVIGSVSNVTGTSLALSAHGLDQFGKALATAPQYAWSAGTLPNGAATPVFSVNDSSSAVCTMATFKTAGTYGLTVVIADSSGHSATSRVTVMVTPVLHSITIYVSPTSVSVGGTCQFTAVAADQFGNTMTTPPAITWSASSGTIHSSGQFTAPASSGIVAITATSGSVSSTLDVTVSSGNNNNNNGGGGAIQLQDPVLNKLVNSLAAAGPITRADMIQILDTVVHECGTVSATDTSDLKTILKDAAQLQMPGYVQVLAGDIINGSLANANYQGQALGDLAAGSSSTLLTDLVNKWFLGMDHPGTDGYGVYEVASGTLFANNAPSYNDVIQGSAGDCYLMSALGAIADSSPAAIRNMFIDNGDGTWTVRFYSSGAPDYVTVDNQLPVYYGDLFYAGRGEAYNSPKNVLWVPLAEKAYAEWNETLRSGRNGVNDYYSLTSGWTGFVSAQVLGHTSTDYFNYSNSSSTMEQAVINGLADDEAVTISITTPDPIHNIIGNHAYMVIGYSNGLFQLANPWGRTWDPGPLSWSVIAADSVGVSVCSTVGSVPINAAGTAATAMPAVNGWYAASGSSGSADTQKTPGLSTAAVDWLCMQQ